MKVNHYELHCIAGDDLTLAVDFTADGQALELSEEDQAELILHFPDGVEQVFEAVAQDGSTATFVFSGAQTADLAYKNPFGRYQYCVRLQFADGTQHTPIHREPLIIKRC